MLRGPIRPSTMLILAAMVLGISAPSTPCAAQARPNNVFVLTDDLDLSLVQFMPHVLEMERPGVSFANYFVTDSLCCPSRPSIFTGGFPTTAACSATLSPMAGSTPTAMRPAPSQLRCSAAAIGLGCSANI